MRAGWAVPALLLWGTGASAETAPRPIQPASAPMPSKQDLVFFNARLAQREHQPNEAIKLWLLRNALREQGQPSPHDPQFRSVLWAALGDAGLCPDGVPRDEDGGAGLWPLALHNWLVHQLSKGPPPDVEPPFGAFDSARQQRLISMRDVLSAEELRSATFFRTGCTTAEQMLAELHRLPWVDLDDRERVGEVMRQALVLSRETLVRSQVLGTAAIEARIFGLHLTLAHLQGRALKRRAAEAALQAREKGISKVGAEEVRARVSEWPERSEEARFLRASLDWTPEEWLTLSRDRRLFLFDQARPFSKDPAKLRTLMLGILDRQIAAKQGAEVAAWIGFLDAEHDPEGRAQVGEGERGVRLLSLDPSTGFRERGPIALQRGVQFLGAGEVTEALRSFGYALQQADSSAEADATHGLARRWLSFTLSRFSTSDEVIATLRALVPREDLQPVIEDLLWRAALHADRPSFERLVATLQRGTAFAQRIDRLRNLASGDPGALATALRGQLAEESYSVLQFAKELLERLEAEDGDVRRANVPTLKLLRTVLEQLSASRGANTGQHRNAEAMIARVQGILDGLDERDLSDQGKARALAPDRDTFAGSIRLAPADPLPWPFHVPESHPPTVFAPLVLEPVEWRDAKGALVFGWRISE